MEQYGHRVARLNRDMRGDDEEKQIKTVSWADEMRIGLQKRVDDRVRALGRVDVEIRVCRGRILEREQQGLPKCKQLTFLRSELVLRHRVLEDEIKTMNKMLNPK